MDRHAPVHVSRLAARMRFITSMLLLQVHAPWWNYLSMGIDAESAWGFAHLRETRPHLARTRGQNMAWYAWYSCASGWFCPGSYALQDRVVVQLQVCGRAFAMGWWRDVGQRVMSVHRASNAQ